MLGMLGMQTDFIYVIALTIYERRTYQLYVAISSNDVFVAVTTCF